MRRSLLAVALSLATGIAVDVLFAGYEYASDFTVVDGRGGTPCIDRQVNSGFSHEHAKVEDGKYVILVSGNVHYFSTPRLRDFICTVDLGLERIVEGYGADFGLRILFRNDREGNEGHVLRAYLDKRGNIAFDLDRQVFATFPGHVVSDLKRTNLMLSVAGERGTVEFAGLKADFTLPTSDAAGYVGIDSIYAASVTLTLHSAKIVSPECPVSKPSGSWHFEPENVAGFLLPPVYDVTLGRYDSGEYVFEAVLSGTQLSKGTNRIETGGMEWGSFLERLDSPYVRIESDDGTERAFYFWKGIRQSRDPRLAVPEQPWPARFCCVLRRWPRDARLAAGYESAVANPWRWLARGRYELVLDEQGRQLYEGDALGAGRVAIAAKSPVDKKIVGLVPRDIPGYADARKHAEQGHVFFEGETPRFDVAASAKASEYAAGEIALEVRLTDVYGKPSPVHPVVAVQRETEEAGGIRRVSAAVSAAAPMECGVWHLVVSAHSGKRTLKEETFVFEVLSDDPNGPCPPLASGLPEFVSMPNEIRYLESDAFDPWRPIDDGMSHYYTTINRYPAVGNATEIWRLLPLYRRRWFCWSWVRNCGDRDIRSAYNRELIRHCDVFGGEENGTPQYERFDFSFHESYTGHQLRILRDYLRERRPALKLLTVEDLDRRLADGKSFLSSDELKELVETCWRDFIPYARAKADEVTSRFDDYVFSVNPKAGRGGYGPMSVYTSNYKTAYNLEVAGRSVNQDPRVRKNGSFFLLEEYHFSCDYPICRASLYLTSYDLMYPNGRPLYPEIYYAGWVPCLDGAVFRAHPEPTTPISPLHQKRIVYQYGYATPRFRDGECRFWTGDGFHARNPEREAMVEFVGAWGKLRENRPADSLKAPFVIVDAEAFRRHGDYFEDEYNLYDRGSTYLWTKTDVCNTAEEGVAYASEKCALAGYATPVVTDFAELDRLDASKAEFVILPPLGKDTPDSVRQSVRRLHARGVGLLISEEAVGLEDLFGVKRDPDGPVKVSRIAGDDGFAHKLSFARYVADGAEPVVFGDDDGGVPIVFHHRTATGRTVFVNVPPTVVRRSPVRDGYTFGQCAVSERMAEAYRQAFAYLSPAPAVKSERGSITATRTKTGDVIVTVGDDSPIYNDASVYPAGFRFTVSAPGIGRCDIETEADHTVVAKTDDKVVLRTWTERHDTLFFKFKRK